MSSFRRRLLRALAGALAIAALAASPAGALPAEQVQGSASSTGSDSSSDALAPTVTRSIDDGFDLGSAAIGAGGATALLLLSAAGASTLSSRRRQAHPVS
jgi:hypothetical protein